MMKMKLTVLALAVSLSLPVLAATTITGAGSTFVYPVLSVWASDYAKATGVQMNYQAIGSAGGIAQLKAGTVAFAASDKPVDPADLTAEKWKQFPLARGQIVLSDNVKINGRITLNPVTLADIYLGQIQYWDDAAIQKLNPGLKLPHQAITVVYRADGSGTTYNFTQYLDKASAQFKSKIGSDTTVSWPTGVGAKGNAGVANFVKTIPGSIGYVEYAYAKQNNLSTANTPLMMATTYAIMPENSPSAAALNAFFSYCFAHPEAAKALNYVPVTGK